MTKVVISAATNEECNAQAVDGYGRPVSWPASSSGWWFFVGWKNDDGADVSYAMEQRYDDAIRVAHDMAAADGEHLEVVDEVAKGREQALRIRPGKIPGLARAVRVVTNWWRSA